MQSSKELKVCGAIGPCFSMGARGSNVSETEIGAAGTNMWKVCALTPRTTIAFYLEVVCQVLTRSLTHSLGPRHYAPLTMISFRGLERSSIHRPQYTLLFM